MPSLLRPPSHRGPLIAAGATVLTVGVALQQLRQDDVDTVVQLLVWGGASALLLWLSVGSPLEGGRPPAYQSVLIVCGLLTLVPALLHLADLLGADFNADAFPPGTGTWVSLTTCGVATLLAVRRNSGIAAFLAAVAGAAFVAFAIEWVAEPGTGTFRVIALLIAITLVVLSLVLRGSRPRQSEQMVNAAGLAILSIPVPDLFNALFAFFGEPAELLPGFWELVVLAAGFGLVAYAAVDRTPGPAYLGVANLAAFVAVTTTGSEDTLQWWPFTLLAIGGLMLAAGLRPARPLPPEPEGYRRDELPLSSRVEGGETVYTLRD